MECIDNFAFASPSGNVWISLFSMETIQVLLALIWGIMVMVKFTNHQCMIKLIEIRLTMVVF